MGSNETSGGPKIKALQLVKAAPAQILSNLKPHLAVNDGGNKTNNNTLYLHCKSLGCEYIVSQTRAGVRSADGGCRIPSIFVFVRSSHSLIVLLSAQYLDNNNLSGARKRFSEEGAEEDDGSFSHGSDDTPEKMSAKKQTTPGKACWWSSSCC